MPSISPDGSRIAYASDRSGTWNIYLMNVTGGQAVQITNDAAPQLHPSWSPDGERLVYCRLGDTTGRWELWVIEVSNPAVRHFIGYGLLPDWSPVENKIAFQRSRQRGDHFFSVWTIDFIDGEGMNPTEIVSSATAATVNPSFSPDGRRLAFAVVPNPEEAAAGRPQIADLWICNLDGTGKANLTGGVSSNLMPTWGKDNRIFFISDRSGTDNIWALRPDRAILAANGPNPNNPDLASSHQSVNKTSELATVPDDNDN
jgi:TolB protein